MARAKITREEWLNKATDALRPLFKEAGEPLPKKIRASVGWPGGRGPKRNVVGQCWQAESVSDSTPAVFISPVLKDPVQVLVTMTHELVHAKGKRGHRSEFSALAKKVGLVAPWKSTPASDELTAKLKKIAKELGPYDHGTIAQSAFKVQSTRLLKVQCPKEGYVARITRKWIDYGLPTCPKGHKMVEVKANG